MKKQNNPTLEKQTGPQKPGRPMHSEGDKKKAEELRKRGEDTNKPGPLGSQKNLESKPGFDYESYGEGDAHTGDNNPHRNEGEEDLPSREPEHKPYVGDNPDEIREQSPKMK